MNTYLKQLMDTKLVDELSNRIREKLGINKVEISVMYTMKSSLGVMRLIDANNMFIDEYDITDFVCKKRELSRYALDHKSQDKIEDKKVKNAYFSVMSQLFSDYKNDFMSNAEIGAMC